MWQPNRSQWAIIWTAAVIVMLAWPHDHGRSLLVQGINWAVDPANTLPTLPPPLPMGLDDDGDAVAAHDLQATAYYERYASSPATRWRMDMKAASDPFEPATERQLLVGCSVLSMLAVWQLNTKR